MKTLLFEDNDEGIAKAAEILKKGGLVASVYTGSGPHFRVHSKLTLTL